MTYHQSKLNQTWGVQTQAGRGVAGGGVALMVLFRIWDAISFCFKAPSQRSGGGLDCPSLFLPQQMIVFWVRICHIIKQRNTYISSVHTCLQTYSVLHRGVGKERDRDTERGGG